MPVSPLLTTLTHKFPPKGVYGAREKLVKPGLSAIRTRKPSIYRDKQSWLITAQLARQN
jgi:hypothetical protein